MESKEDLKELTNILLKEESKLGLRVNDFKANFMNIDRQEDHEDYLVVQ